LNTELARIFVVVYGCFGMGAPQIERYFCPETRHPTLQALGRSYQRRARKGIERHRHCCTEICLVTGGGIGYFTGEESYALPSDAVQLSQPGQWHGTAGQILNPCTLTWLQVDTGKLVGPEVAGELGRLPCRMDQGASRLMPLVDGMLEECRGPDRFSVLAQESRLRLLLVELLRLGEDSMKEKRPFLLRRALAWIDGQEDAFTSTRALAEALRVHRSHLHAQFVRHLGVSPRTYLKGRRLRAAAKLLSQSGDSITAIALDLGFSSSQHFSTAFRMYYGLSPGGFRQQARRLE
jgi:AraC family transcriptional regulator, L-rhamnose operon regulatory protein RhaS